MIERSGSGAVLVGRPRSSGGETVKVKATRDIAVRGEAVAKGSTVEMSAEDAAYLLARGRVEKVSGKAKPVAKPSDGLTEEDKAEAEKSAKKKMMRRPKSDE